MNHRRLTPFLTRMPYVVAFLVSIAIPLRANGVAPQQAALVLALLGALVLLAIDPAVRNHLSMSIRTREGKAVSSIFVAWAITIPFSFDSYGSLEIGGRTGGFVLASAIIWAVLSVHRETHQLLWKALLITAIAVTVAAILSLNGVPYILSAFKFKLVAHENPTAAFKAYAAAAMCMSPAIAWTGRRLGGKWRWWGYAFAPMALVVIIQTHNRSALVGFLAMALIGAGVLAMTRRKHTKSLIALGIAIVASGIAWVRTQESWRPAVEGTFAPEWLIDTHRQIIWKFSFERFLDHPWVGNGIDQLNNLPGAKVMVPILKDVTHTLPSHPHNWAIEILAETGILGFAPVVIALALIAWRLLRNYITHENETDLTLLIMLVGFWASALFNFSIWAVWWQLTFFILFAMVSCGRYAVQPLKVRNTGR